MTPRGRFITLEGIEGAGKSTVAAALAAALRAHGLTVVATREPGGTPLAERLREVVLQRGTERIAPEAETLLMFAARAVHVENLIRPALARGEWVICDRYTDATRAYQGGGRGVSASFIETLSGEVLGGFTPDLTLLLDLPVMTGLERAHARRRAAGDGDVDRFESETVAFFDRVRARYLEIATADPGRVRVLDATKSAAALAQDAVDASAPLLAGEQRPR
ncbi:MAG: dTMP kinase [Xanthomonadales bacterium]|jgi:dTMP kinase|nr:dTMP kinase [Xanthomonadales bacterium]